MKIDNTNKTYIPFRFKCGLKAYCTLDVYEQCPTILQILENDVNHCLRILPFSVHDLIRRTKLWINVTYVYGDIDHPKVLKHMNTHHYERWLHWYVCNNLGTTIRKKCFIFLTTCLEKLLFCVKY